MTHGWISTALYVAACLVIPFAWGVLVHWAFQAAERLAARRPKRRGVSGGRSVIQERVPSMWDFQI